MKTYRTIQGDMWDSVAYKQLGSSVYTDKLMRLNPQHRDIYIFPAGIELLLPDIDKTAKTADNLPPWKR